MPELPEAETISRELDSFLAGRVLAAVAVLRPDVVAGEPGHLAAAEGKRVVAVGRRGKNVVARLEDGARIVVNLGMTGRLLASGDPPPAPGSAHPAVFFHLEGGGAVTYDDVRRFGRVAHMPRLRWEEWSARLGPEPLSPAFTAARWRGILSTSRSPVRSLLLDQRKVAGVGNIYAVESLWRAAVHPAHPANDIRAAAAGRLHRRLRSVLRDAIRANGTTLRDYRTTSGEEGAFGLALRAYGAAGRPCPRCAEPIERLVFGGRSAFLCPRCQRLPAGRAAGGPKLARAHPSAFAREH